MAKGVVCLIVLTVALGCVYCAPRLRARRSSLDGVRKRRQDPYYENRQEELMHNLYAGINPMFYQHDAPSNRRILMDERYGWPLADSDGRDSMNPWYNFRRRYQARNKIQRLPISQELRGRISRQMSDGMISSEHDQAYF